MIVSTAVSGVLLVSVTIVAAISAVTRRRSAIPEAEVPHTMKAESAASFPQTSIALQGLNASASEPPPHTLTYFV